MAEHKQCSAMTIKLSKFIWSLFLLILCNWFICCDSYLVDNNPYRHVISLDGEGKYLLEWMVLANKRVIFNVTAETTGYVGFGLSRRGKMTGADIVIGGVRADGKAYFTDRHAIGHQLPVEDAHQDWTLHSAWESGTHTFLSFSRAFDSCDKEDYPITEDSISLIWAFGENDDEVEYHFERRGNYDVYLLDPDLTPKIVQPTYRKNNSKEMGDLKVWTVNKLEILPQLETFYTCTFHKAPRFPKKHHIVGFSTILFSPLEYRHIHSFVMYRCHPPPGRDAAAFFERYVRSRGEQCYNLNQENHRIPTANCREPVHIWAVGGKPMFLPDHVGIPVSESANEYYMIQAHYENPERIPGIRLQYTVEMFYTSNVRKHDAGLMLVGQKNPDSASIIIPPSSLGHFIYGHCGSGCTKQMFPETGIHIFASSLHTHKAGRGVRLLHIRDDEEAPWIAYDDNYNFNFQQSRILRKERTIMPGDQLINRCSYETSGKGYATVGGVFMRHEQCLAALWYYNKMPGYGICDSEIRSGSYLEKLGLANLTWSDPYLEMIANPPSKFAGLPVSEICSRHIKWNIALRTQIQDDHRYLPQITQCPKLIPGMTGPVGTTPEPDMSPTLQRYTPKEEPKDLLPDSEYVSVYSKDVVPFERSQLCVKQTKQVVQVSQYQTPLVTGPFPTGEWWTINTKAQGY